MRVALRPKTVAVRTSSSRLAAGATLSPQLGDRSGEGGSCAPKLDGVEDDARGRERRVEVDALGGGDVKKLPQSSSQVFSDVLGDHVPVVGISPVRRVDPPPLRLGAPDGTIAREGTALAAPVAPVERRAEYLCEVGHRISYLKQRSVTLIGIRSDGLRIDEANHRRGVDPAPEAEDEGPRRQVLLGTVSFLVDAEDEIGKACGAVGGQLPREILRRPEPDDLQEPAP